MPSLLQQIYERRKLIAIMAFAAAIVIPVGVRAMEAPTEPEVAEEVTVIEGEYIEEETEEVVEEVVVEEENVEVVVVETTEETTEVIVEEEVTTEEVASAVTIEEAALIAAAEHPESTIVKEKAKNLRGSDVIAFVFYFEDGWKVYVNVYDGSVYKVIDGSKKEHHCKNTYWKDRESTEEPVEESPSTLGAFSRNDDRGDNDRDRRDSRDRGSRHHRWHR